MILFRGTIKINFLPAFKINQQHHSDMFLVRIKITQWQSKIKNRTNILIAISQGITKSKILNSFEYNFLMWREIWILWNWILWLLNMPTVTIPISNMSTFYVSIFRSWEKCTDKIMSTICGKMLRLLEGGRWLVGGGYFENSYFLVFCHK